MRNFNMCGYCIEAGFLSRYLENEFDIKDKDDFKDFHRLACMTHTDISEVIESYKKYSDCKPCLNIFTLRYFINQIGNNDDLSFQFLRGLFAGVEIEDFLAGIKDFKGCRFWRAINPEHFFALEEPKFLFHQRSELLCVESKKTLKHYCDWWLKGDVLGDGERLQPMAPDEHISHINELENTAWDVFHAIFRCICVAFVYSISNNIHHDEIEKIALHPPRAIPDFEGFDLWLQRVAFSHCVRQFGISFVEHHYQNIRSELLAYAMYKNDFSANDLEILAKLVGELVPFHAMPREEIAELINNRLVDM